MRLGVGGGYMLMLHNGNFMEMCFVYYAVVIYSLCIQYQ